MTALAAVAMATAADASVPASCLTVEKPSSSRACQFQATAASVAAVSAETDTPGSAGESLSLAQRQAKRQMLLAPRSIQPIAFIKTHKTGGSTTANILNRMVLRQNLTKIFPEYSFALFNDLWQNIDWPMLRKTVEPNHQFDIICNHQMFDEEAVRAYLKRMPFIFSILREPIAMIDSLIRFNSKPLGKSFNAFSTWASRLHLMEAQRAQYSNPMARDLGWYDGIDIRRFPSESVYRKDNDERAIHDFILKIDRAMDLVFLTEHYDEGLVLLKRKLRLSTDDVMYLQMKVDPHEDIPPPTPEEQSKLKEFLRVDMALYDYFSERFWSQWNAFGGDDLGPELQELKQRNEKLALHCAEKPREEKLCPLEFTMDSIIFDRVLLARQNESYHGKIPEDIMDHFVG